MQCTFLISNWHPRYFIIMAVMLFASKGVLSQWNESRLQQNVPGQTAPGPLEDSLRIAAALRQADSLYSQEDEGAAATLALGSFSAELSQTQMRMFIDQMGRKGIYKRQQYDFKSALYWHEQQLFFAREAGDLTGYITALNNLGLLHRRMDRYAKAIDAYQQALKLSDSIGYERGYVFATNGLGNIYLALDNFEEALRNFRECLRVEQLTNNLTGVAINLNNIGHVYLNQQEADKALEYFMLSLEVNRELNNSRGVAISYSDMGEVFMRKGMDDKALNYFLMSLQLNTSVGDLYYLAINNFKAAEIYIRKSDFLAALPYVKESIRLAELTDNRSVLKDAFKQMYLIHKSNGKTAEAITYLEKSTFLNDSILNENTQKVVFQMQAMFNREQADNKIALLENEKQLSDLKIKRQMLISYVIGLGAIIMLGGLTMMIIFFRLLRRKNKLLEARTTEIIDARDKLEENAKQLVLAKQEAEMSNKLKSQFLANMSHEIRTPMNSVIGFTDILAREMKDPVQLGYLELIKSSGQSLLVLINDILDLSKIESGKIDVDFKPFDVKALLEEVKRFFEPQAQERNIDILLDVSQNFPRVLHFSESSLRQILINLLGNAVKFTSSGMIKLTASMKDGNDLFGDLFLEIADTGQGIPQADIEHIFEAFYQTNSGKTVARGTGLGLTITKKLVEALGGNISVQSIYREGTTFRLHFPAVTFIPERTHLRLITSDNLTDTSYASICLLSQSLVVKTLIEPVLAATNSYCDVYAEPSLLLETRRHFQYKFVLVDERFFISYEAWMMSENLAMLFPSSKLILIHENNLRQTGITSFFEQTFQLPGQNDQLKNLIFQWQTVEHLHTTKQLMPNHKFNTEESQVKAMAEAFQRARQFNFVQDAEAFNRILNAYAEQGKYQDLIDFSFSLERDIEAFDVEKIANQLNLFLLHTNIDQLLQSDITLNHSSTES